MKGKEILIGAHITIGKGFAEAVRIGEQLGCTAIQIFTKSSRSWKAKKITKEEAQEFIETLKNSKVKFVVAHASYLINIGSNKKSIEKKSVEALKNELERCDKLTIPYLILHPGAHLGAGEEKCIKQIASNIREIFKNYKGKTKLLLENMAGQGTTVGYLFPQLKKIISLSKSKKFLGICLDTCHAYSAGYDFSTPKKYKEFMKELDKLFGIKNLKVIHTNDSKTEINSHIDRHENIGKGKIPLNSFKYIMRDKKLKTVPKILETPTDEQLKSYKKDLKTLIKLANG